MDDNDADDVIGRAPAQAPVEESPLEDANPAGVSAQVQLDGTIPFTVTRNPLSPVDFRLYVGVTNAPTEYNLTGDSDRFVKRGDGILERAATSNGLTGGVQIEKGGSAWREGVPRLSKSPAAEPLALRARQRLPGRAPSRTVRLSISTSGPR